MEGLRKCNQDCCPINHLFRSIHRRPSLPRKKMLRNFVAFFF